MPVNNPCPHCGIESLHEEYKPFVNGTHVGFRCVNCKTPITSLLDIPFTLVHTHKFVYMKTESYWRKMGRYNNEFVSVDYFFCEGCLEEKQIKKQCNCLSGHHADLPDWAKVITQEVAGHD